MQNAKPNLFTRDDTFFGVCEAIGRDLGFHPNWLRLAFAAPLMFVPLWAFAIYGVLAAVVIVSRLAAPEPRQAVEIVASEAVIEEAPAPQPARELEPLPLAA